MNSPKILAQKIINDFKDVTDPLLIAKGSMGEIYRVKDKVTKKILALKTLSDEMMKNKYIVRCLKHEYDLANRFTHKNLIHGYRWLETKKRIGFLMDYINGTEFKVLLHEKKLQFADKFLVIRGVVDALHYMHTVDVDSWIIHCDIKPENILVKLKKDRFVHSRSDVHLVDYGTAMIVPTKPKLFTGAKLREFFTRQRVVGGSYLYMSPEQTEAGQLDPRSDIYSLGCLMYETFSGVLPFKSSLVDRREGEVSIDEVSLDREELAYMHQHEEPEDPRVHNSHLQSELVEIIMKCLEKDPSKRFQSAYAVAAELAKIKCYRGEELIKEDDTAVHHLRQPMLIAIKGSLKGLRFPLKQDGVIIGRQLDNEYDLSIPTDDNLVSGRHCKFSKMEENIIIEDLNSRNGTFVNGEWVKRQILRHNDKIKIGKHVFKFCYESLSEKSL